MPGAIISEILLDAIDQLRPELPALLGSDYAPFVAQLEVSLAGESESPVWELFEQYPTVNEHLQQILEQVQGEEDIIRGGLGLYGKAQFQTSLLVYRCEMGVHDVAADQVEERDAQGNVLCPQHGVPMRKVDTKENEPHQKPV
jgi:hypothetical protein